MDRTHTTEMFQCTNMQVALPRGRWITYEILWKRKPLAALLPVIRVCQSPLKVNRIITNSSIK